MWIDKQLIFSEDQAISGSASDAISSTNVIDLGSTDVGEGNPIEIIAYMTTAATVSKTTTATSTIQVALLTSSSATFTTGWTTVATGTAQTGSGTTSVGYSTTGPGSLGFNMRVLPNQLSRYVGLTYTIGAGMEVTAGNIFAALVLGQQNTP